jgi:hypothetical protein
MSDKKVTPPSGPTVQPTVGKLVENSQNIPQPKTKQPTQTPTKKDK